VQTARFDPSTRPSQLRYVGRSGNDSLRHPESVRVAMKSRRTMIR
jgi:hypothetical protein